MARNFDAVDDMIGVGTGLDFSGTQSFTVAAWIRPAVNFGGSGARIISRYNQGVAGSWFISLLSGTNGSNTVVGLREVSPFVVRGVTNITSGVWWHIAMWYGGSASGQHQIWVSGALDAAGTTGSIGSPTISGTIGCQLLNSSPAFFFNGDIAELGVWSGTLTSGEMIDLSLGVCPSDIRPDALMRHWPLWGANSPEPDLSTNVVTGTLSGTAKGDHPVNVSDWGFRRIPRP